ncbi:MAG: amidohydrolase [Oscillospiraceae bacterium]|nr:amidohydrolase [Oscillospiraceae bacterium]
MQITEKIITQAEALQPEMVAQRRDFHKYAESGWFEMRTTSIIARKLTELGYEVLTGEDVCDRDARMGVADDATLDKQYERAIAQGADPEFVQATRGGMTGAIGILRCGEGPTVALRFDIDALGVIESQDADHRPFAEGWNSVNPGMMHACGHDGHATVGLGVAKVLMDIKEHLRGTVKLIFQPAEEGVRGAKSIVAKGHLNGVDYLLGTHVTGNTKYPNCMVCPGAKDSLATSKYDVIFHGKSAHAGGSPNGGNNAMLAAATAVLNLQAIPRHGGGATRINVGKLVAGSGRNVICDEAFMEIETRGANTELNTYVENYALRILENAAAMHGCTVEYKLMGAAESLTSDVSLAQRLRKVWEAAGFTLTEEDMMTAGGSEDFSYMMNAVQQQGGQATFFRTLTKLSAGAHNRRFDFDEVFLQNGVKLFCTAVYDLLKTTTK